MRKHAVYLAEEGGGKVATLDGDVAQQALLVRFLQNVLLNSLLTYQPSLHTNNSNHGPQTSSITAITDHRPPPSQQSQTTDLLHHSNHRPQTSSITAVADHRLPPS